MLCPKPQAHIPAAHMCTEHICSLLARLANLWTALDVGGGQGTEGSGDKSSIVCTEVQAFSPRARTFKPQNSQSLLVLSLAFVFSRTETPGK